MKKNRVAILGIVGLPAKYGGFETLAQNLVHFDAAHKHTRNLTVYCSAKAFTDKMSQYRHAELRYIELDANGPQSIAYDTLSLIDAIRQGNDRILLLGVSGALFLPFVRLISRARIITNVDGIEWKRKKWSGLAKIVLRVSEWAAVEFSHRIIADNQAIADYVAAMYSRDCDVIPYGGDHAIAVNAKPSAANHLPKEFALSLCRIEPENNVHMILEAFAALDTPLVFVGNWNNSRYGRELKERFQHHGNITIHDPVYEPSALRAIRDRAIVYVHGHSAGGTNPSLVEMMHFGIPILAQGCSFNRHTTEEQALYFMSAAELTSSMNSMTLEVAKQIGEKMAEIASRRYTWESVGRAYFDLLDGTV